MERPLDFPIHWHTGMTASVVASLRQRGGVNSSARGGTTQQELMYTPDNGITLLCSGGAYTFDCSRSNRWLSRERGHGGEREEIKKLWNVKYYFTQLGESNCNYTKTQHGIR